MMNMLPILLFLFTGSLIHAMPAGRTNFLSYGPGAAEESLGGAVVGTVSGPNSLYYNSARLGISPGGVSVEWTRMMPGVSYSWLGAASQFKFGSLGIGVSSLELGDVTARSGISDLGTNISSYERSYMIGTARQVMNGLLTGTTFGLLDINLAGYGAKSFFSDVGASYRVSEQLSIGATLKNLYFSGLSFGGERERYPAELRLGASYEYRGLLLLGQADKILDSSNIKVVAGVAYSLHRMFVLRGGFNGYPTFGFGLKSIGNRFGFDFSYQPRVINSTQRLTLSYAFKVEPTDNGPVDPYAELTERARSLADYYREEARRMLEGHSMAAGQSLRKLLALEPWNSDAAQALSAAVGIAFSSVRKGWPLPWMKRKNRVYLRFAVAYGEDKVGETCAIADDFKTRWPNDRRGALIAKLTDKYGCK